MDGVGVSEVAGRPGNDVSAEESKEIVGFESFLDCFRLEGFQKLSGRL